MTTLTQDYQMEWNGLLLGTDTPYDIVAIIGAGIPSVRSNDVSRLDDHGTWPGRRELLDGRTMNLEIDIIGTGVVDLHEKVSAFKAACLPSEVIRPLYMRVAGAGWGEAYDSTSVVYGFARQLTANTGMLANANSQKAYLQIEIPDPRVYSEEEFSEVLTPGTLSGGWTFPWTFPWTFGTISSGSVDVINTGAFDTPPVVVINGPATSPRVQNLTTGEFMQLDFEVMSGETLTLNFRDKTALLNGIANRWNYRRYGSTWFPLRPGSNPIQYTLAAGSGSLTIYWRNAWL